MHGGNVPLAGPLWWIAVALFGASWLLSAVVGFDALRGRRLARFEELPESRWVYTAPSLTFFVVAFIAQFARIGALAIVVVLAAPLVFVLAMVYGLRVVFPGRRMAALGDSETQPEDEGRPTGS